MEPDKFLECRFPRLLKSILKELEAILENVEFSQVASGYFKAELANERSSFIDQIFSRSDERDKVNSSLLSINTIH